MFTGIVEHLTRVEKLSPKAGGAELFLDFQDFYNDLTPGESIAVNGVCLTLKAIGGSVVSFDVSGETLKKTTTEALRHGERVNIERALKVGDRLGGHFVTGHVDGISTLKEKKQTAGQCTIYFSADRRFTDMMIEKGSVSIDGISLTIVDVSDGIFSVALIPFTLFQTTLGFKNAGDRVNIEIDMMGKWVKKLLANMKEKRLDITQEQLREEGFLGV